MELETIFGRFSTSITWNKSSLDFSVELPPRYPIILPQQENILLSKKGRGLHTVPQHFPLWEEVNSRNAERIVKVPTSSH